MKKIKYLLFIFLFCIFINVKAVDNCTSEEMNRLRELANKVEFKQEVDIDEYEEEGEKIVDVKYYIDTINFNEDLKIKLKVDDEEYIDYNPNDEDFLFSEGTKLIFKIYSYTDNLCTDELLRTVNINFDYYNRWYHDNQNNCQKYSEFKYCKEYIDTEVEQDKITELFNQYKKEQDSKNGSISKININYIYIIIGSVVIILGLLIFILIKKNKKEKI